MRSRGVFAIAIVAASSVAAFAGLTAAHASDPPVKLSPTSGPAGTSITVTLPLACKLPKRGNPYGGVNLAFVPESPGGPGAQYASYPENAGDKVTHAVLVVPADAPAGHYTVSGSCFVETYHGYTVINYGKALFTVTGGKRLPALKVAPTTGPTGTKIHVSGRCKPSPGEPTADFATTLFSSTDPNVSVTSYTSGTGPIQKTTIKVPATFAPGSYLIAASCFDYETSHSYTESNFTVTGGALVEIAPISRAVVAGGARPAR